jgi:hypothetical protein
VFCSAKLLAESELMKPIEVVVDKTYPNMWRVRYNDGVISEEMYNLTRANDILKNYRNYVKVVNTSETPKKQPRGAT